MFDKWEAVNDLCQHLEVVSDSLSGAIKHAYELRDALRGGVGSPLEPYENIIDRIPVNPSPTHPPAWWLRRPSETTGITIHHTLSHDPASVARYVIREKGRPTLPYHFWTSRDGDCWLCVPLEYGMWHDHTGHQNLNISVGMAGHLHKQLPTLKQMGATVRLVAWLMEEYDIPLGQVQGHNDRYAKTICPGWDAMGWRHEFYDALDVELGG